MDDTYKLTEATTWRELDDEIVVLDTRQSVYFSIGGFGSRLWPLLVAGTSKAKLVAEITSTFEDVSPQRASDDVDEFLASLFDLGLIEAASR